MGRHTTAYFGFGVGTVISACRRSSSGLCRRWAVACIPVLGVLPPLPSLLLKGHRPTPLVPPVVYRKRRACVVAGDTQFVSSSQIAITKTVRPDRPPVPWRADPGPLKLVAIDTGAGIVELNPEDGGVVVATVKANVMVQDNESLHIYQSTKEVQVTGSGFEDAVIVSPLFSSDLV